MGGHPVKIAPLGLSFTLFDANPTLRGPLKEAHELIGNSFYFVIGLHALAALWHHFVKRDATLRRILPQQNERARWLRMQHARRFPSLLPLAPAGGILGDRLVAPVPSARLVMLRSP